MVRKSRYYRPVKLAMATRSREKESHSLAFRQHIPWHSRCLSHIDRANRLTIPNDENSSIRRGDRLIDYE
jgi:hypothetical protein